MRALVPERRIRRLLKLEPGEACLLILRRTFSNGRIASVADLYHPGSRYELAATCQPRYHMTAPSARAPLRAPRGTTLSCRSWLTEAPLRMLMNNLDPEVAERPGELVVYGGIGKAARNWQCYEQIVGALRALQEDETLLIQSGKPVGVFRTHADAPRVLLANSNLVARWADWEHFNELDRKGLMMFGQMTAGSWIYIGSQGIVQGTYETFVEMGRQHYGGNLAGRWILTAGLGGMGGAQPLAATMAGASMLAVECRPERIAKRLADEVPRRAGRHARGGARAARRARAMQASRSPWGCSATPAKCSRSCCAGAYAPMPSPIRPRHTIR